MSYLAPNSFQKYTDLVSTIKLGLNLESNGRQVLEQDRLHEWLVMLFERCNACSIFMSNDMF